MPKLIARPRLLAPRVLALAAVALLGLSGAARAAPPQNTMLVEINQGGDGPMSKRIDLSLAKAAIVNLPTDAADVLVANPEVVDAVIRTPRRAFLLGQAVGQTNVFFFDGQGREILNLEIQVERDLAPLAKLFGRFLPQARIVAEAINDNVVLTGSVPNTSSAMHAREIAARFVGDAERVMNMLTVESGEQVMLKVRVAEMQRTLAKQLGVNLEAMFDIGSVDFDIVTRNPFSVVGQFLSESDASSTIGYSSGGDSADAIVRALERTGLVRILAEPALTAVSGEAASFLAGGEFPVPSGRDREGNVTIEFKPFGVGLGFTPVVLSKGRISLRISTEVSDITNDNAFLLQGTDPSQTVVVNQSSSSSTTTEPVSALAGVTVPGLNVRRAETTVELPSGGSLVIAGLLQESTVQNIDGYPGLKDLPVLGALFRSRDFQKNETELVVIVTPYLVNPVNQSALALPTDGLAPASDLETALLGRLNTVYGVEDDAKVDDAAAGPVGFIIE